jgi:DNA-binding LacI/PurR family transcriptional regulator
MQSTSSSDPTRRTPTIRDVAAAAGVSYQSVSRVLNTPDVVRTDTRARVEVAIVDLGYVRNDTAAALGRRRAATGRVTDSPTVAD